MQMLGQGSVVTAGEAAEIVEVLAIVGKIVVVADDFGTGEGKLPWEGVKVRRRILASTLLPLEVLGARIFWTLP